jgi:RNA polymerase sigma-70 factor (ECF subfamily)
MPQDSVVQELSSLRGWVKQTKPADAPRRLTNRELLERATGASDARERSRAADELLRQVKSLAAAMVDQRTRALTANEIDDLAQEVMIRLLQTGTRGGAIDPTPAYIGRILTNLLIDQVRHLKRRGLEKGGVSVEDSYEAAAVPDPQPSVESSVLGRMRRGELRAALSKSLKPTEASVVWLRAEGASHQEIAAELNLREDNVRKQCERALKRLKKLSETGALPAVLALD